jgi:hypothetical protein
MPCRREGEPVQVLWRAATRCREPSGQAWRRRETVVVERTADVRSSKTYTTLYPRRVMSRISLNFTDPTSTRDLAARTSGRRQTSSIDCKALGELRTRLGHGDSAGGRRVRRAALGSGTITRCRRRSEKNVASVGGATFHQPTRSSHHRKHWREYLSRGRPGCGDAHQERGYRDVPGIGELASELSGFQA